MKFFITLFFTSVLSSCRSTVPQRLPSSYATAIYQSNIINFDKTRKGAMTEKGSICPMTVYSPQWNFERKTCGTGAPTSTLEEMKGVIPTLPPNKTIIIGNGGAGAIGLIGHLAKAYNKSLAPHEQVTIIWRGAHSFQNLRDYDHIDLGITYEPDAEKLAQEKGKILEPTPIFLNHFELSAPHNDPLCIKSYIWGLDSNVKLNPSCPSIPQHSSQKKHAEEVILIMERIITRTLTSQEDVDNETFRYASRYNHSAMGEKDHTLFVLAIHEMVLKLLPNSLFPSSTRARKLVPLYGNIPGISSLFNPSKRYTRPSLAYDLMNHWMKHVRLFVKEFPWDMMKIANETGLYHLNDRAFYRNPKFKFNPDQYISKISDTLLTNLLINPAQMWITARHKPFPNSVAHNFMKWVKGTGGQTAIRNFIPAGQKKRIFVPTNSPFNKIYNHYQGFVTRAKNVSPRIYERWMNHLREVQ